MARDWKDESREVEHLASHLAIEDHAQFTGQVKQRQQQQQLYFTHQTSQVMV